MTTYSSYIDKNLLSKGKNSKCLKYAIGEIVRVIIGILIALQTSNCNDRRKEYKYLNTLLLKSISLPAYKNNL